jgi:hypothetical protein
VADVSSAYESVNDAVQKSDVQVDADDISGHSPDKTNQLQYLEQTC